MMKLADYGRRILTEQFPQRVLLYFFAIAVLALGVVLNVNAALGISPIAVLPFVSSRITGLSLGTAAFLVFACFAVAQVLILRREFQWIQLTQIFISRLTGLFVDAWGSLLGDIQFPGGYAGQIAQLLIGTFFVSAGVALHMQARLITLPPAALIAAITRKLKTVPFFKVKIVMDSTWVALGALFSFLFMGDVIGIREGTVIAAVLTGWLIPLINRISGPVLKKMGIEPRQPGPPPQAPRASR